MAKPHHLRKKRTGPRGPVKPLGVKTKRRKQSRAENLKERKP